MRLLAFAGAATALLAATVTAQDPGPSPTASIGCEPHDDHWHCDGPAPAAGATPAALSSKAEDSQSASVGDPGPSPTASIGCYVHDDHWHCQGSATITTAPATGASAQPAVVSSSATSEHDHDHDNSHSSSGASAAPAVASPSPTESTGCEPHDDHWHCDDPAESTGAASVAPLGTSGANATTPSTLSISATPTSSTPVAFTGAAADGVRAPHYLVLGLVAAVGVAVLLE